MAKCGGKTRVTRTFSLGATGGVLAAAVMAAVAPVPNVAAVPGATYLELRDLSTGDLGLESIGGVTFDPVRGRIVVTDATATTAVTLDATNDPQPEPGLDGGAAPATFSVEPRSGRVIAVDGDEVVARATETTRSPATVTLDGLVAAEFDRRSGDWVALVGDGAVIETFSAAPDAEAPSSSRIDVPAGVNAVAIATNPADGLAYVLGDRIVSLDGAGNQRASFTIDADLGDVVDMVFAPSLDLTDAPTAQSLFVVDMTGGRSRLVELVVERESAGGGAAGDPATLFATRNLALLNPPAPDSSGIAYNPAEDRLIVTDSEVEEMNIFQNVNVYELTRTGTLSDTGLTVPWSDEPTGAGFDPETNRLLTSDDDANQITLVTPGTDGRHATADDTIAFFNVNSAGNADAEGVAYDTSRNQVLVVDGVNNQVYKYSATGTVVSNFDVGVYGAVDPEGIAWDPLTDHILVLDHKSDTIYVLNNDGTLASMVDIAAANPINAAGLEIAPASDGSGAQHFYIVDRGVDNDGDPNENDGKLYEMIPPGGGGPINQAPQVSAGADASVTLPATASLVGTASDDGLPSNTLTTTWSETSGPGTVAFGTPAALSTTATFSAPGTYVLRLTATDGAATTFDETTITVASADGTVTIEFAVSTGADDAEQNMTSGTVSLTNGDLELGVDEPDPGVIVPQQVGLRFQAVTIPPDAIIDSAYIQFTVDETPSLAASLLIQGQAADTAPAFTTALNNISTRTRTTAQVNWTPSGWSPVGAAGPAQQTPSIASIIQELVDRPGWTSGNALALIVSGTGRRTAEAFEGGAALAARLHIDYRPAAPPVNVAPTVTATATSPVTLPAVSDLGGTVNDDGLPTNTVTTLWTQVSGPGTVTFGDAAAVTTTASFSAAGEYVLRLTADDGALTGSDDVSVTVSAAPATTGATTGVFRPTDGNVYLKFTNEAGFADVNFFYGTAGDVPVAGDWDGDGVDSVGIFRNGIFYLRNANTPGNADLEIGFGQAGDLPVAGDWDGDGDDTIGIYRDGIYYLRNDNSPGDPDLTFSLGGVGDVPIAGDWDGDGTDTTGVFRPTNGFIYMKLENTSGFAEIEFFYGIAGDQPVTGDWDDDGIDTIGIYRDAFFYLRNSNTPGFADAIFEIGVIGDMPIAGRWT